MSGRLGWVMVCVLVGCTSARKETRPWGVRAATGPQPTKASGGEKGKAQAAPGAVTLEESPAIWIAPIPGGVELEAARKRGVATLIDVSTDAEVGGVDMRAECVKVGIEYVGARPSGKDVVTDQLVDRVLGELRRYQEKPLMMVSGDGSRAAMLFGVYRVVKDGVSLEQGVEEAKRCGMKPGHPEVFVRQQVERVMGSKGG